MDTGVLHNCNCAHYLVILLPQYYVTMVVVVLYIIEAGLTIIAYSFIYSKKAYLRKAANILDIFVIIMG